MKLSDEHDILLETVGIMLEIEKLQSKANNLRREIRRSKNSIRGSYVVAGRLVTVDYEDYDVKVTLGESVTLLND